MGHRGIYGAQCRIYGAQWALWGSVGSMGLSGIYGAPWDLWGAMSDLWGSVGLRPFPIRVTVRRRSPWEQLTSLALPHTIG